MRKSPIGEIIATICVGLPFCIFKIIFGQFLYLNGFVATGTVFIYWGSIDISINLLNLITLLFLKRRVLKVCLLNYLVGLFLYMVPIWNHKGPKDFGTAIDVLVAFGIVAIMVGGGLISKLTSFQVSLWNWCVVFNILYAGINRVWDAANRFEKREN